MSNFGEKRYRLLMQQCEKLVGQLSGEEVRGGIFVEEQAVRLLTGVIMLLRQHRLNKRGQCRICAAPDRIGWFWRRRPPCTVHSKLNFALNQGIDAVWWQLMMSTGRSTNLNEVRRWLPEWEQSTASRRTV